jgi:hypothetical protein
MGEFVRAGRKSRRVGLLLLLNDCLACESDAKPTSSRSGERSISFESSASHRRLRARPSGRFTRRGASGAAITRIGDGFGVATGKQCR